MPSNDPKNDSKSKRYRALTPIELGEPRADEKAAAVIKRYEIGSTLTLDDATAAPLLAVQAIAPVAGKDAEAA